MPYCKHCTNKTFAKDAVFNNNGTLFCSYECINLYAAEQDEKSNEIIECCYPRCGRTGARKNMVYRQYIVGSRDGRGESDTYPHITRHGYFCSMECYQAISSREVQP